MKKTLALLSILTILLTTNVTQAGVISDSSVAAWWNSVRYDGTNTILPGHDEFFAAGSYGSGTPTGWSGSVPRGIVLFNTPFVIRNDHPGHLVQSATLTLDLNFFDAGNGHLDFLNPPGAPGAHAYHVEIDDHTTGGVIIADDYFAPQLQDLGIAYPATPGVPSGGTTATIDITSALQAAVDNPAWGDMFAVRVQFGSETDGLTIDDNLYFSYFFDGRSSRATRLDWTVAPIPEPGVLVLLGLGAGLVASRRGVRR